MSLERKCLYCNTWNKANDFCINCGKAISPAQLNKERLIEKTEKDKQNVPTKFDLFLAKIKTNTNPFIKIVYYILASVWAVYVLILGIILYLAAATPG